MAHQEPLVKKGTQLKLGKVEAIHNNGVELSLGVLSQVSGKNVVATLAEVETHLEKEGLL